MLGGQAGADLEQRLFVSDAELIEDRAPRRIGDGAVDVNHTENNRQSPPVNAFAAVSMLADEAVEDIEGADPYRFSVSEGRVFPQRSTG